MTIPRMPVSSAKIYLPPLIIRLPIRCRSLARRCERDKTLRNLFEQSFGILDQPHGHPVVIGNPIGRNINIPAAVVDSVRKAQMPDLRDQ